MVKVAFIILPNVITSHRSTPNDQLNGRESERERERERERKREREIVRDSEIVNYYKPDSP